VRAREPDALETVDLARGAQQLAESLPVAELDAVGVHVLPEQRHLYRTVFHEQPDLVQDVAGTAVLLLAPQAGHDAERAGVVASDRDRDPSAVRGVSLGRQRRGEDLEGLEDLEFGVAVVACTFEKPWKGPHVVSTEHDVDPGCFVEHRVLVHLRQATAHGDLHALFAALDGCEVSERAVELARSVVANRAGVDDDDVCLGGGIRTDVPCALQ
jgi:hypothetical protein